MEAFEEMDSKSDGEVETPTMMESRKKWRSNETTL